jgi:TPR repeat protein
MALPAAAEAASSAALDAGMAAYQAGDFAAARHYLRPLADRGSAIAETMLGVMASRGEGRAVDPAVAAGWWLRAANRGYAPAQLALAKALAKGNGVPANPGQAWLWARLAASVGNGVSTEAQALATELAAGFSPTQMASLEAERAAWRPWPAP